MLQSTLPGPLLSKPEVEGDARVRQILAELERLLASPLFRRSPSLSRLLAYLVEHHVHGDASALKETVIGTTLYGRQASYDPKIDAVVRVNAKRLRERLEEYYVAEPPSGVRIGLQRGSYIPIYEIQAEAKTEEDPAVSPAIMDVKEPSGSKVVHPGVRWTRSRLMISGMLLALLYAGFFALRTRESSTIPSGDSWSVRPFARFGGSQNYADFSPDGQTLVFVSSKPDDPAQNLYLQEVISNIPRQITNDSWQKSRPVWSPDGQRIAYLRLKPEGTRDVVMLTPATGNQAVVTELQGRSPWLCRQARLSWSRDGKTLFSSALSAGRLSCGLVAIDIASHAVRIVTEPPIGTTGDLEVSVSTDGKSLAFLRASSFMSEDLFTLSLVDGTLRQRSFDHRDITGFAWREDSQSLIVASNRTDGDRRLWTIPLDGRLPKALTDGISDPYFPSLGDHDRRIVFTRYEKVSDIWLHTPRGESLVIANGSVNATPAVSADGRHLVYNSNRAGIWALWVSDTDGRNARQLLGENGDLAPSSASWSPDGARIAFECRKTGNSNICTMQADGSHVEQITQSASNHILPSWSRDGKSIYYSSDITGRTEIFRQALTGGAPVQVTHRGGVRAVESFDGKTLYVHCGDPLGGLVALPVAALDRGDDAALRAAENKVFLRAELGPQRFGEWQPGKVGILFSPPTPEGAVPSILSYQVPTGRIVNVARVAMFQSDATSCLALGSEEQSFYYRKENSHTELALMQRKTAGTEHSSR